MYLAASFKSIKALLTNSFDAKSNTSFYDFVSKIFGSAPFYKKYCTTLKSPWKEAKCLWIFFFIIKIINFSSKYINNIGEYPSLS